MTSDVLGINNPGKGSAAFILEGEYHWDIGRKVALPPRSVMLTRVFVIGAKTRIKDGVSHEWNIGSLQTPTVTHWWGRAWGFLFSNIL